MAGNGAMVGSVLMRVVASCVSIGHRAGKIIRDVVKSGELGVVDKTSASSLDDNKEFDPQTEADRTAQMMIVGSLKKQYPELVVLGEEEGCEDPGDDSLLVLEKDPSVLEHACPQQFQKLSLKDLVVWVDPLDGTAEFTEGHLNHVTVLIGIAAEGNAVAGVVCQPFYESGGAHAGLGRQIWGVVGLGAFGIDVQRPFDNRHIVTTTKSHSNNTVMEAVKAMNPDSVIRTGGSGFKVLQVLEGVADAYVYASAGTKKWDSCAPEAIIRAAGGNFTDLHGNDIKYHANVTVKNWGGLLVTLTNHSYYLSRVPQGVKENLPLQ